MQCLRLCGDVLHQFPGSQLWKETSTKSGYDCVCGSGEERSLVNKIEEKQKDYDFKKRMEELRQKEEKSKTHRKEQQRKKRRAEEDLTFEEEDDEMAAVMGFSGFGSTKKSY